MPRGVKRGAPRRPYIKNLNTLLHDIYVRYIALTAETFHIYYRIVFTIFLQMHEMMKDVNSCYCRNSSTVQFAGSHPDHLRIIKPNEFDIDIVIDLPLNKDLDSLHPEESDFVIKPQDPGFVQIKVGIQYENFPKRFNRNWKEQAPAFGWRGKRRNLSRSKFMSWFKGVVNSALNRFYNEDVGRPLFFVDDEVYTAEISESGPAMTLYIRSLDPRKNIQLDIDLVPALRFPINRWPIGKGYRRLPKSEYYKYHNIPAQRSDDFFMAVPKPSWCRNSDPDECWRLAMHEQERILMHDTRNMRQAIRLMKKFRDAQGMEKIASYYIKTIFFWEVDAQKGNKEFWNHSPAYLFEYMLYKLYDYLNVGVLPYFWHIGNNSNNNLLHGIKRETLNEYAWKVFKLLKVLAWPEKYDYRLVAKFLLTKQEYNKYKNYLY
ncbi:hypothetical protein O0L34_g6602 [Tuta absoluta]|nr:hypothetical protein O0L34_g6602 [Tuta absoluta]